MQPSEGLSISRRTLDYDDYIDILRRHKGWIFGPFLFTLVASVVGVFLWPDTYDSVAVIAIKPQQISQSLVAPLSNQSIVDRITQLSNQVMSRSDLTEMIRNMNLYPREKNRMPIEDVLEIMRKNIRLSPMATPVTGSQTLGAFQVAFTYYDRLAASKVVSKLVSNFVDQDVQTRGDVVYQQVEFMQDRYNDAKKRLDEADAKLTQFKLANPGKLPDQYQANLAAVNSLGSTSASLTSQISLANSEKLSYENQIQLLNSHIEQLQAENKTVAPPPPPKQKSLREVSAEADLDRLKTEYRAKSAQFRNDYPGMRELKAQLDSAQVNVDNIRKEEAAAPAEAPAPAPVNLANQRQIDSETLNIQNLKGLIKSKEVDIVNLQKQQKETEARMSELNGRILSLPVGDQQMTDLIREQSLARDEFNSADALLSKAQTAKAVQNRNQGEKLEMLDAPSVPVDPTDPNRPMVIAVGAVLGLVLGLVIAGAREVKDTSLKNLKDVRAYTQMAILGSVPLLENDFVVRRRRRIAWLGWTAACLVAVLVMAGSIVYYYTTVRVA